MKSKRILSGIIAIALFLGCVFIPKSSDMSLAKTKNIAPAGKYYKLSEKAYREITINKTSTGIDYKINYNTLTIPYDYKNEVIPSITNMSGSAVKVSKNTYRHNIGELSLTFKVIKKNKIRYIKLTQKGKLPSPYDEYSLSGQYTHILDEQSAGGPEAVVKKAKKPGRVKITYITSETEKLYVNFKSIKKNCKGYQAQISKTKKFKAIDSKFVEMKSATGTEFKGLVPLKKYYVRIRAYNVNSIGKKTYGKWSKVKTGIAGS